MKGKEKGNHLKVLSLRPDNMADTKHPLICLHGCPFCDKHASLSRLGISQCVQIPTLRIKSRLLAIWGGRSSSSATRIQCV